MVSHNSIIDIHNSIMDIHNYWVYVLLAFHTTAPHAYLLVPGQVDMLGRRAANIWRHPLHNTMNRRLGDTMKFSYGIELGPLREKA